MSERVQTVVILAGMWTVVGLLWITAETAATKWRQRREARYWRTWVTRQSSVWQGQR